MSTYSNFFHSKSRSIVGLEALKPMLVNLELKNHKEYTNTLNSQILYHEENSEHVYTSTVYTKASRMCTSSRVYTRTSYH